MTYREIDDYEKHPDMVHWFNPVLLAKLLNNVITSAMFGQYADRRLVVAALDKVDDAEHVRRATALHEKLQPKQGAPVWFDFVADLGDGFDSTYAVATLLGQDTVSVDGKELPRGQLLVMGGDEVYPLASQQTYSNQLLKRYRWASPGGNPKYPGGVPLFAIPGNHDWYDGLVLFLAYFCREKPVRFGSWRTQQRRSYFAIQLTETWWLWAIDIQLAEDMDEPQAAYFNIIAKAMPDGARIVLCSAEPGWLYTDTNTRSWEIMDFAIGIAEDAQKKFEMPILLSGDTHHYSRYAADDGTQFITSGGGGAFLHPTHQLEEKIKVRWRRTTKHLSLGTDSRTGETAVYPSMKESRRLIWGNWKFAVTNRDFSLLMGFIYFLVGLAISLREQLDTYVYVTLLLTAGLVSYAKDQEKVSVAKAHADRIKIERDPAETPALQQAKLEENYRQLQKAEIVTATSLLHVAAHAIVALTAAHWFAQLNLRIPVTDEHWLMLLLVEMGLVGFFAGSTIFGLNMLFTGRWLRMNRNDSFSALRIGRFNNFLRVRIDGDAAEIHAVGLENVPQRHEWIQNPKWREPGEPRWILPDGCKLTPHLIEKVQVSGARSAP